MDPSDRPVRSKASYQAAADSDTGSESGLGPQLDFSLGPESKLLLQFVRQTLGCPTLEVCLSPLMSSVNTGHRELIRRALVQSIRDAAKSALAHETSHEASNETSPPTSHETSNELSNRAEVVPQNSVQTESLFDLSKRPECEGFSISIAHCGKLGGFAHTSSHYQLGFDIESPERIQEKTVARVSTKTELSLAPSPAHLWVAKEAAFKSLASDGHLPLQPKTMSQLEISHWVPVKSPENLSEFSDSFQFQMRFSNSNQAHPGKGVALPVFGVFMAFFISQVST